MKLPFRLLATVVAMAAVIGISACNDDDNPTGGGPTTGTVSGTVTFDGTWPSTGDVQVSIYSQLPPPFYVPMGPPDAFTNPITGSPTTYNYEMSGLTFGDYAGILVSWRDPANPSGAKLLGQYWVYVDSLGIVDGGPFDGTPKAPYPTPVTLNSATPKRGHLDIRADLSLSQ